MGGGVWFCGWPITGVVDGVLTLDKIQPVTLWGDKMQIWCKVNRAEENMMIIVTTETQTGPGATWRLGPLVLCPGGSVSNSFMLQCEVKKRCFQSHLHQVTVMLQHAAGRLPGVLVTLPGVHPAPNPPDIQNQMLETLRLPTGSEIEFSCHDCSLEAEDKIRKCYIFKVLAFNVKYVNRKCWHLWVRWIKSEHCHCKSHLTWSSQRTAQPADTWWDDVCWTPGPADTQRFTDVQYEWQHLDWVMSWKKKELFIPAWTVYKVVNMVPCSGFTHRCWTSVSCC